eukprot:4931621-Amphidinium_carterae.1
MLIEQRDADVDWPQPSLLGPARKSSALSLSNESNGQLFSQPLSPYTVTRIFRWRWLKYGA